MFMFMYIFVEMKNNIKVCQSLFLWTRKLRCAITISRLRRMLNKRMQIKYFIPKCKSFSSFTPKFLNFYRNCIVLKHTRERTQVTISVWFWRVHELCFLLRFENHRCAVVLYLFSSINNITKSVETNLLVISLASPYSNWESESLNKTNRLTFSMWNRLNWII